MHVSFKEVLDRLLMLVALPVRQMLAGEDEAFPPHLVANTCYLLATIISELAASSMGLEVRLRLHPQLSVLLCAPLKNLSEIADFSQKMR